MTILEHFTGLALCGLADQARSEEDASALAGRALRLAKRAVQLVQAEQAKRPAQDGKVETTGAVQGESVLHSRPDLAKPASL